MTTCLSSAATSPDAVVEIDWLAVVAGTVGYVVLGALRYGPMFGSTWVRSMGYDGPEDVEGEDPWTTTR